MGRGFLAGIGFDKMRQFAHSGFGFEQMVSQAGDFEQAIVNMRAVLRPTAGDFDLLKAKAIELGQTTKFFAVDVANGMQNMALAGFSTEEILGSMKATVDLAAASGMNIADSAKIADTALRSMGMTVEELPHLMDVLATTFTKTNTNLAELSVALKYVAPVAKLAGLELEDMTAILGRMASAGYTGSIAGTSLRAMLKSLQAPTKDAKDMWASIGVEYDKFGKEGGQSIIEVLSLISQAMESGTKDVGDFMESIGVRGAPQVLAALQGMDSAGRKGIDAIIALKELSKSKGQEGIAGEIAKEKLNTWQGQLDVLKSSIEAFFIKIGTPILTALRPYVAELTEFINELVSSDKVDTWVNGFVQGLHNIIATVRKVISDIASSVGGAFGVNSGDSFMDNMILAWQLFTSNWEKGWQLMLNFATIVINNLGINIVNMIDKLFDHLIDKNGWAGYLISGKADEALRTEKENTERGSKIAAKEKRLRDIIGVEGSEEEVAKLQSELKLLQRSRNSDPSPKDLMRQNILDAKRSNNELMREQSTIGANAQPNRTDRVTQLINPVDHAIEQIGEQIGGNVGMPKMPKRFIDANPFDQKLINPLQRNAQLMDPNAFMEPPKPTQDSMQAAAAALQGLGGPGALLSGALHAVDRVQNFVGPIDERFKAAPRDIKKPEKEFKMEFSGLAEFHKKITEGINNNKVVDIATRHLEVAEDQKKQQEEQLKAANATNDHLKDGVKIKLG